VVEEYVNTNPALCLCADVANYLKHGALLKHRSRQFSKLGEIQYSISNDVRTTITFMAREVIMTPEDANQVEVLLPILDADDNQIAETCSILNASIRLWENFMESRGVAA
jgi:hypothetical protein